MKTFSLNIYTPYGHYLSDKVEFLQVSSEDFTLGILPDHAPLITTVKICEIDIEKNGIRDRYATSGGVMKIQDNKVVLLLNTIESADEIDLERAERAKERAESRLLRAHEESINVTRSKLALERATIRIRIKKGI